MDGGSWKLWANCEHYLQQESSPLFSSEWYLVAFLVWMLTGDTALSQMNCQSKPLEESFNQIAMLLSGGLFDNGEDVCSVWELSSFTLLLLIINRVSTRKETFSKGWPLSFCVDRKDPHQPDIFEDIHYSLLYDYSKYPWIQIIQNTSWNWLRSRLTQAKNATLMEVKSFSPRMRQFALQWSFIPWNHLNQLLCDQSGLMSN